MGFLWLIQPFARNQNFNHLFFKGSYFSTRLAPRQPRHLGPLNKTLQAQHFQHLPPVHAPSYSTSAPNSFCSAPPGVELAMGPTPCPGTNSFEDPLKSEKLNTPSPKSTFFPFPF